MSKSFTQRNKEAFTALSAVGNVVDNLIAYGAYRATKYVSPTMVVNATRRGARKATPRKGVDVEIVLSIGRPNVEQVKFIKKCRKAGEPFPVKNVQIKLPRLPR